MTIVFQAKDKLSSLLTGDNRTIGIRISDNIICQELLKLSGVPITSTSANISGQKIDPVTIEDIPREIYENVDMVVRLEGRLKGSGSTIVDISGNTPVLIREGALKFQDILTHI